MITTNKDRPLYNILSFQVTIIWILDIPKKLKNRSKRYAKAIKKALQ
jgi:hypothetical protein